MTHQRKRGLPARIWRSKTETDNRGNATIIADADGPYQEKVWQMPDRSAKAEVPGQAKINVIRIGTSESIANVALWSRVEFDGKTWDIASPVAYHHGTRHTRHCSVLIRERPSG